MSAFFDILDLDDSGSLLPAVSFSVAGFPLTNLQAIYLFEDGAVGSNPTSALDSSGNGNHAVAVTGSSITRIAGGIESGSSLNNGFLFQTPVAYAGSYTIFGVTRNRVPNPTSGSFPVIHTASGSYPGSGLGAAVGENHLGTRGAFLLNNDGAASTNDTTLGVFNKNTSGVKWAGTTFVRVTTPNLAPRQTWNAFALSVNAVTGEVILRSNGGTVTFTSLSELTTYFAGAGFHAFGYSRYVNSNITMGDMGLFGIYSGTSSIATLDALITAAKSRMAIRGISAV